MFFHTAFRACCGDSQISCLIFPREMLQAGNGFATVTQNTEVVYRSSREVKAFGVKVFCLVGVWMPL